MRLNPPVDNVENTPIYPHVNSHPLHHATTHYVGIVDYIEKLVRRYLAVRRAAILGSALRPGACGGDRCGHTHCHDGEPGLVGIDPRRRVHHATVYRHVYTVAGWRSGLHNAMPVNRATLPQDRPGFRGTQPYGEIPKSLPCNDLPHLGRLGIVSQAGV